MITWNEYQIKYAAHTHWKIKRHTHTHTQIEIVNKARVNKKVESLCLFWLSSVVWFCQPNSSRIRTPSPLLCLSDELPKFISRVNIVFGSILLFFIVDFVIFFLYCQSFWLRLLSILCVINQILVACTCFVYICHWLNEFHLDSLCHTIQIFSFRFFYFLFI